MENQQSHHLHKFLIIHHTMNFADYGMKNLNSVDLASQLKAMEKGPLQNTLNYLVEKIGYDHTNPKMYQTGLDTVAGWGLIPKDHSSASVFFCESQHAKDVTELTNCLNAIKTPQLQNLMNTPVNRFNEFTILLL